MVKYASSLWGLSFIALLEAENWLWTIDRQSLSGYWRNGKLYHDYGFCQISNYYHPTITGDARFYTDWKWQIGKCYELYIGGTTFYGLNNVHITKKRFEAL